MEIRLYSKSNFVYFIILSFFMEDLTNYCCSFTVSVSVSPNFFAERIRFLLFGFASYPTIICFVKFLFWLCKFLALSSLFQMALSSLYQIVVDYQMVVFCMFCLRWLMIGWWKCVIVCVLCTCLWWKYLRKVIFRYAIYFYIIVGSRCIELG